MSDGFAEIAGRRLEMRRIAGAGARTIVFLHEGLGAITPWRDFPDRLCAATGCPGLVYARAGYGRSASPPAPRAADYLHRAALDELPALLAAAGIRAPVLFGHSDGASIALIHAGAGHDTAALIVEAPHVFVEELTLAGIRAAGTPATRAALVERLHAHHDDAGRVFADWHDTWLSAEFRDWNIEASLLGITAPTLLIQGADDQYGTRAQLEAIARGVRGPCETLWLEHCGHSPHRDRPDEVIAATARLLHSLDA